MFGKVTKEEHTSLLQRVGNLEIEIEKLKTHINSLRGLINKRSKDHVEDGGDGMGSDNHKNSVLVPQ